MSLDEHGTGVISSITATALVSLVRHVTRVVEGIQASVVFTYLNEREGLCPFQAYMSLVTMKPDHLFSTTLTCHEPRTSMHCISKLDCRVCLH